MKPLIIKPTEKSPLIELKEGELNFRGCSIINDPRVFFDPVLDWLEEYVVDPPDMTVVNIDYEYIDSASVKTFYEVLKILEPLSKSKKLQLNWYYEVDDPEILELGEIIQAKMRMDFVFVKRSIE